MSKTETVVDMSPDAIARRLRTVSELFQFSLTLKNVKWLGKVKDLEAQRSAQKPTDSDQGH